MATRLYRECLILIAVTVFLHGYARASSPCTVDFKKVGCYHDNNRPLPDLLLTSRDPSATQYYDADFKWEDIEGSIRRIICECAKRARALNFTYIGIQYYAECWSGPDSSDYASDGHANASQCLQHWSTMGNANPCDLNDPSDCFGKGYTNYVYKLLDCTKRADIVFVVDKSSSMSSSSSSSDAKQFIRSLIEELPISADNTHVGLIAFSSEATKLIGFGDARAATKSAIISAVDGVTTAAGTSRADKALDLANSTLFVEANGMRSGSYRILISLTDGLIDQHVRFYPYMIPMEAKGVIPLSVGFGDDPVNSDVRALARNRQENVFNGLASNATLLVARRIAEIGSTACA